jgi:hypothetical protein
LIRGIGPSLTVFGVADALADPTLELRNNNGDIIAANDDWRQTQQAEIEATGLPPSDDRESAIIQTLSPGAYTAIVRGKNDTIGVALVEAYQLGGAPTPTPTVNPTPTPTPNTNRNADSHADTHSNANSHADTHSNANSHTDAKPDASSEIQFAVFTSAGGHRR